MANLQRISWLKLTLCHLLKKMDREVKNVNIIRAGSHPNKPLLVSRVTCAVHWALTNFRNWPDADLLRKNNKVPSKLKYCRKVVAWLSGFRRN
jgi:hypothetical protein